MPHGWPTVSCIVNTYNRAHLLPRALASVLDQQPAFPDFEVIVVDDASTDGTPAVIRQWAKQFDVADIVFNAIRMAENSGAQASPKNRGIELARGDFIRFLDDDNEWTPGSLLALVEAAEAGDVWPDGAYGRREYVIDDGAQVVSGGITLPTGPSPFTPFDPARLAVGCMSNYIDTSDFILSRGAFWWLQEHTGMMWNEGYRRFGDWELLCRATNLDRLLGLRSIRLAAVDAVVSRYHWVGGATPNLQLTRALHETPQPVSGTTRERF